MKKKKRGRPPIHDPVSERIAVRITPKQRDQLINKPGLTLSEKIRRWLEVPQP